MPNIITQSDFDELGDAIIMSDPSGYCYECEQVMIGGVEPDAHNYECELCGTRNLHGTERIMLDITVGATVIKED